MMFTVTDQVGILDFQLAMSTVVAPEAPFNIILPEATNSNQIGQKEMMQIWLIARSFANVLQSNCIANWRPI